MEEINHQGGTSMNLEVTDNNLYLFLPGKIARMIQICTGQRTRRADTYRRLTDQSTKLWHYGPTAV